MYPEGVKNLKLTANNKTKLRSINIKFITDDIITCHACHSNLKKNNIPAHAFNNLMDPGETPEELNALNELETRLISRIKPFMKIYKYRTLFNTTYDVKLIISFFYNINISFIRIRNGQHAFKGSCTHFAQCVEEINEQLPLGMIDSQVVVVSETLEGLDKCRDFKVRPKKLRIALEWLIKNNKLYEGVKIINRVDSDFQIKDAFIKCNTGAVEKKVNAESKRSRLTGNYKFEY